MKESCRPCRQPSFLFVPKRSCVKMVGSVWSFVDSNEMRVTSNESSRPSLLASRYSLLDRQGIALDRHRRRQRLASGCELGEILTGRNRRTLILPTSASASASATTAASTLAWPRGG